MISAASNYNCFSFIKLFYKTITNSPVAPVIKISLFWSLSFKFLISSNELIEKQLHLQLFFYHSSQSFPGPISTKFLIPLFFICSILSLHLTVECICSIKFFYYLGSFSISAKTLLIISINGFLNFISFIFLLIFWAAGIISEQWKGALTLSGMVLTFFF